MERKTFLNVAGLSAAGAALAACSNVRTLPAAALPHRNKIVVPRFAVRTFQKGERAKALSAPATLDGQFEISTIGTEASGIARDAGGTALGTVSAELAANGIPFSARSEGVAFSGKLPLPASFAPGKTIQNGPVSCTCSPDGFSAQGSVQTAEGTYQLYVDVAPAGNQATLTVTLPDGSGLVQQLAAPSLSPSTKATSGARKPQETACQYGSACETGGGVLMAGGAVIAGVTGATGVGGFVGAFVAGVGGLTWLAGAAVSAINHCAQ